MSINGKYNPKEIEDDIYNKWIEKKYFKAKVNKEKEPFTIVMPPPNITGQLHMGHALDNTLQDIFVRYNRMIGKEALWLPGTDHASIATETKVVEKITKEGKTKEGLGREKFLEETWVWKEKYGGKIIEQLKKLGSSCDWSRERFTMDEGLSKAVEYVFVKLYHKGLIYRGERIVNWCPVCSTSISDNEVEYQEQESFFWHIKYKLEDSDEYIVIATTRPETMLGDTAIAVHPEDERYTKFVGKNVILPIANKKIPIIADSYVEKDFGTGALKITPAHDPNDYELGLRHKLESINVMNENATIREGFGKYSGMTRENAREEIVNDLKISGDLIKVEPHTHNVGSCYRCHATVEPYASKQWFVRMEELAKPAILAVKNGEINFIPKRFEKTYFNWMENIRDWCISRQLWWGHRIPAYHCESCGNIDVSEQTITSCSKCNSNKINRDEDTLDTWFSSALWPFSTLGWPEKTEDFEYFYPTTMLVTGYDIITFWVSKMIFSGIEHTGEAPFKDVYIHGLVRDSKGRKMSKSLGNGVDPLEVIDEYGADALRFSLVQNISAGNDMRYIPSKVEAGGNFANKIWNAAKFALSYIDKEEKTDIIDKELLTEDKWILTKLGNVILEVTNSIDNYEIGVAIQLIYDFIWSDICDTYIEMIKPRLYSKDKGYNVAVSVLNYILINALKLLHPYMPFVTEKVFLELKHDEESIMVSQWPVKKYNFEKEEKIINECIEGIKQLRNIRAEANVPTSKKAKGIIVSEKHINELELSKEMLLKMGYFEKLSFKEEINNNEVNKMTAIYLQNMDIYIDMSSIIDEEAEKEKLLEEKANANKELKRAEGMLSNERFISKAPETLVNAEKEKVKKYSELILKIEESLNKY
ncbi:MAG: valine--tRNA ligase [Clostridia bacterium]|nr:valine--tRNA ligase [Clostridia bacterium]